MSKFHFTHRLCLTWILLCLAVPTLAVAQQVGIGTVAGEIRVGSDPTLVIDRADFSANLNGAVTTKSVALKNFVGTYSLALTVPQTSATYQISR